MIKIKNLIIALLIHAELILSSLFRLGVIC